MESEASEPEALRGPWSVAAGELVSKGRISLMIGVLAIELGIFFASVLLPVDPATKQAFLSQANTISREARDPNSLYVFALIVSNNLKIALVEFLPGLGAFAWTVTIYTTGQLLQVIAVADQLPPIFVAYALFLYPFAILELSAYAVAVSSGIMVIVAWARKRLWVEARVLLLELGVVAGMIFVAGAMEALTLASPVDGLGLWMPFLALVVVLALWARKFSR